MVPSDYLVPVLRLEPNHGSGFFTVGVDPREAEFLLARGWLLIDGVRWRVSLAGCDGGVQGDGRIQVACHVDGELEAQRLFRQHRQAVASRPSATTERPQAVKEWWAA